MAGMNTDHIPYTVFIPVPYQVMQYATYMNIQFSIFHRLRFLKRNPRYRLDWIGVAALNQDGKMEKLKQ